MAKTEDGGRVLFSADDAESKVSFLFGRKGEKCFIRSRGPRVFVLKVWRASA